MPQRSKQPLLNGEDSEEKMQHAVAIYRADAAIVRAEVAIAEARERLENALRHYKERSRGPA